MRVCFESLSKVLKCIDLTVFLQNNKQSLNECIFQSENSNLKCLLQQQNIDRVWCRGYDFLTPRIYVYIEILERTMGLKEHVATLTQ